MLTHVWLPGNVNHYTSAPLISQPTLLQLHILSARVHSALSQIKQSRGCSVQLDMYFIVMQLRKDRACDLSSQLHIHYQQHICSLFNASSQASSSRSSHCRQQAQQADLAPGQGGLPMSSGTAAHPNPCLGPLTLPLAASGWKHLQGSALEEDQGLISEQQRAQGLS